MSRRTRRLVIAVLCAILLVPGGGMTASADGDELDPVRNVPLACEFVSTPGLAPRSAKDIAHLANVCGFVGTDVEFQSRTAASGVTRDFAFVGTMGFGLRIFDITDPAHPTAAGGYTDPGWQGDVQVRGDVAVVAFDPIGGRAPTLSLCLQAQGASGGVDIIRLAYDPVSATFTTALIGCVKNNPGGGAHNATLSPSGEWLAMSNPRVNGSVDVVDLRGGVFAHRYRIVQKASLTSSACPATGVPFRCISNGRNGAWSPHELSFSADGATMYVAAVGNDTVIVDVSGVLAGAVSTIGVVPNDRNGDGGVAGDPHDISISHQSDPSADGAILVITDERGGGLGETRCNSDPNGMIGGAHFWALAPVSGRADTADAATATPRRLGGWFYPNPLLAPDPLAPAMALLPRAERACTIHVFRNGGNGTAGPGPIAAGYDGVSRLGDRELVVAHYGAGVWHLDFSGAPTAADGTVEDVRTSWANTRGWNVMPGAETWSAKEYKGYIYAGDMVRGFDVYAFARCDGVGCVVRPQNVPGKASGGGQTSGTLAELAILRGLSAGGRANFGFNAQFASGDPAPSGHLTYIDHAIRKDVRSTSIESFSVVGNRATFSGRATVDGVPGITFFVEVEDLGETGDADTFRIVLGDGYSASGLLLKGNIQVRSGLVVRIDEEEAVTV